VVRQQLSGQHVLSKFKHHDHAMSYKEIADVLTAQEGKVVTDKAVEKIVNRALAKLKKVNRLKEFEDLLIK